jgi:hypothetical protein
MRKLTGFVIAISTLLSGPAVAGTLIVLKTREVELRGSNGHVYDVVHGISVRDGVRVQEVYST